MDKWLKRKIIEENENSNNNKNSKCQHVAKIEIKQSAKTEIAVPAVNKAKILLPGSAHLLFSTNKIETKGSSERNGILNPSTSALHTSSSISTVRAGTVAMDKGQEESRLRKKLKVNNCEKNRHIIDRDDKDCNNDLISSKVISEASIINSDVKEVPGPPLRPSCTLKPAVISSDLSVIETTLIADRATETIAATCAMTATIIPSILATTATTSAPLTKKGTSITITSNTTVASVAAITMTSTPSSMSGKLNLSIATIESAERHIDALNVITATPSLFSNSVISSISTSTSVPSISESVDSSDKNRTHKESQGKIKRSNLANLNDLFVSVLPSFQMQEKDKLQKKSRENVGDQIPDDTSTARIRQEKKSENENIAKEILPINSAVKNEEIDINSSVHIKDNDSTIDNKSWSFLDSLVVLKQQTLNEFIVAGGEKVKGANCSKRTLPRPFIHDPSVLAGPLGTGIIKLKMRPIEDKSRGFLPLNVLDSGNCVYFISMNISIFMY